MFGKIAAQIDLHKHLGQSQAAFNNHRVLVYSIFVLRIWVPRPSTYPYRLVVMIRLLVDNQPLKHPS